MSKEEQELLETANEIIKKHPSKIKQIIDTMSQSELESVFYYVKWQLEKKFGVKV